MPSRDSLRAYRDCGMTNRAGKHLPDGRTCHDCGNEPMVWRALEAAEVIAADGIRAEVIDPRTIVPLDKEAILESVKKTGRLVIVDEAQSFCGFRRDDI